MRLDRWNYVRATRAEHSARVGRLLWSLTGERSEEDHAERLASDGDSLAALPLGATQGGADDESRAPSDCKARRDRRGARDAVGQLCLFSM